MDNMSTFYVCHKKSPGARTRVKARGAEAAKRAWCRLKGHQVTLSRSGVPLFHGDRAAEAELAYNSLQVFAPTRKGRNPPVVPVEC